MFIEIVNAAEYWAGQIWTNPLLQNWTACQIFPEWMTFWDFVLTIISLFILISGILSIVFILWWGLLLILSGWKDDKIKPAINTIRYAVIWLIITVVSIFVFPILGWLLWIDTKQYASPWAIIEKSKYIGQCVFHQTDNTYWTDVSNDWWDVDFTDL